MTHERDLSTSFLCLVAAPTAFAACAWIDLWSSVRWDLNPAHLLLVCAPLLGLLIVLGHVAITREWIRLLPLVPFGLVAVAFAVSMGELAVEVSREPDGEFIPLVQVGAGFVLPPLAFAGGLISWLIPGPASRRSSRSRRPVRMRVDPLFRRSPTAGRGPRQVSRKESLAATTPSRPKEEHNGTNDKLTRSTAPPPRQQSLPARSRADHRVVRD